MLLGRASQAQTEDAQSPPPPAAATRTETQLAVFDEIWQTVREHFYDPTLRSLDWTAVGEQYRPLAAAAADEERSAVFNRLLAELAASHQTLYVKQAPQVLKALRETALVQSVESSNRIEGVTVEPTRLQPLVLGNARPHNRSEEEIQGYRRALELIHAEANDLPITPALLQRLHRIMQAGAGDAGQWKRVDNEIGEFRPGGPPLVRFRPVTAAQTPGAIAELCLAYRHPLDQEHVPPLLTIAYLVLDFLCIHPFRDGNGRVSRLLTLLAFYQQGCEVGRYISLERLVEESREDYYEVLRRSSEGWHTGQHDLFPWLNYFLAILRRAYREFEGRAGQMRTPRGAKTGLVEAAVDAFVGEFTLAELERACPGVSRDTEEIYMNLFGVGQAVDIVVVTPEDVERYRDSLALVIHPALEEGKVVYGA